MNDKAINEIGFRRVWRIKHTEEGVSTVAELLISQNFSKRCIIYLYLLIRLFIYFSMFSFYYKLKKSTAHNNPWNIGGEITFFASLKVKPNSQATKTSGFWILVRIYRSQFKQKARLKNHFPRYAWTGTFFSFLLRLQRIWAKTMYAKPKKENNSSSGQFYKTFTIVIYKCSYCFQILKQWPLVNYK